MRFRVSLVAIVLAALGGGFAAAGCGGDDCTRADDHFAECAASMTTTTSSGSGGVTMVEVCSGTRACQSQCINQHTCSQITGNDPTYTGCLADCLGK